MCVPVRVCVRERAFIEMKENSHNLNSGLKSATNGTFQLQLKVWTDSLAQWNLCTLSLSHQLIGLFLPLIYATRTLKADPVSFISPMNRTFFFFF